MDEKLDMTHEYVLAAQKASYTDEGPALLKLEELVVQDEDSGQPEECIEKNSPLTMEEAILQVAQEFLFFSRVLGQFYHRECPVKSEKGMVGSPLNVRDFWHKQS
ncbi:hypothetical protein BTVI_156793 [Pitangus sulphuratus]|nr:hypothetical protein BTVI_156793 [Pitangus sulphuratus]